MWTRLKEPNNKVDFIHRSEYLSTQLWPFVIETYQYSSSNLWTYFSDVTPPLPVLLPNSHMSPEAEVDLWERPTEKQLETSLLISMTCSLQTWMLQMICWFSTLICWAMSMLSSESLWTMKDTVASLLKMDSKADILSSSSSKKNKDENVAGLFCGEKKLKIVNSFEWGDKKVRHSHQSCCSC